MNQTKLKLALSEPPKGTVMLPASDMPNHYWHLAYLEDFRVIWEVYIAVNQIEIVPTLFENQQNRLFVGVEQGVFVIDTSNGAIVSHIIDTSYVQWIEQTLLGFVLVPAEDELLAFSASGSLLWRVTFPDIMTDIKEKDGQLEISDVSEESYRLNLMTGKRLAIETHQIQPLRKKISPYPPCHSIPLTSCSL